MNYDCDLNVSFLTWNIYQGFDVTPLFPVPPLPPQQIPAVLTQIFRQFLATNFPVRAKAIAKAIASEKPDLISLQEAVRIEQYIPTFGTVTYDFIEILLEALEERGLKYEVAVSNDNIETEQLLDSNGNFIKFLERNSILIRKHHKLDVIKRQEANFHTNLTIPFAGQDITLLRGWAYVDVKIDGKVFRMINTRLDPSIEAIRNAQASEILQIPANTRLPVIITGDLNSIPNSTTYKLFTKAGFRDLWSEISGRTGFTAEQNADLLNAVSLLNQRIEYALFKNGWEPDEVEVVGESQKDRTKTGLWPSDHAGVSGSLHLEDHHHHHCDESSDEGCS